MWNFTQVEIILHYRCQSKKKTEGFVFWDLSNLGNCFSPDILPDCLPNDIGVDEGKNKWKRQFLKNVANLLKEV